LVDCKKCGSKMRSTFTEEQAKEMLKGQKNPRFEIEIKSSFTCDKCGSERKLSRMEIVKEFMRVRKEQGKSTKDVAEEVKDKIKEFKK
jgi:hypothetical protein